MTSPWPPPDPNPLPGLPRRCEYCRKRAVVFDVDGAWCSTEHQRYDRQSEITYWRKAVTA